MKKWAGLMVVIAVALGIGFFLSKNKTASSSPVPPTQASQDAAVAAAMATQSSNTVAIIQSNFARVQPAPASSTAAKPEIPAGQPAPLQFTNFDAAIVLENLGRAVHQYGSMFGGNPVGNNQEISAQLNGNNPKHINFINAEAGMRLNENGELIDPWGTPYFFHQLSGTDMEIHSAGPDRIMWTSDDLVSH